MSYVMSSREVQEFQSSFQKAAFTVEGVSVEFETTPEFVRSVLPPDLEPVGSSGIASVAQWQCGLSGEFESAAVMLNVRWREFVGSYYLTLFISGDMPVTIGRDLWGEPKKTGECRLYRDADDMYGYGARNGVRGIQIEARFGEELGPRAVVSNSIEVGLPLTHNAGAAGDPWISIDRIERELGAYREGEGELVLTGTPFDPLDEIPVLSTGLARHYTGKSTLETVLRETIPGKGDEYLPFHLGRSFDKINVGRSPMRERSADVR